VKKAEASQAREVTKRAIDLLKDMESGFEGDIGDLFSHFTGLPKGAPPELVTWALEHNNVSIEVASLVAHAFFDLLMVTAAFGFAHGQKEVIQAYCHDCHHTLEGNGHGFDQNDGWMDGDKLVHSGSCTYCRYCNPAIFKEQATGNAKPASDTTDLEGRLNTGADFPS